MQNKANFLDAQMNVNKVSTKEYENNSNWTLGKNKPKQTQFPKSPNECKLTYNKGLQKKRRFRSPKKQTQFKPNSNPVLPALRSFSEGGSLCLRCLCPRCAVEWANFRQEMPKMPYLPAFFT